MVSNNVVPRDPVYMAFGLGISNAEELTTDILDETSLILYRENNNKINKNTLKTRASNLITKFLLLK